MLLLMKTSCSVCIAYFPWLSIRALKAVFGLMEKMLLDWIDVCWQRGEGYFVDIKVIPYWGWGKWLVLALVSIGWKLVAFGKGFGSMLEKGWNELSCESRVELVSSYGEEVVARVRVVLRCVEDDVQGTKMLGDDIMCSDEPIWCDEFETGEVILCGWKACWSKLRETIGWNGRVNAGLWRVSDV